ncbi:MAG: hypothetical protein ACW99A_06765 [Candidatus Kariarchaeaceae archaeon]|jgi:hypothetical protein
MHQQKHLLLTIFITYILLINPISAHGDVNWQETFDDDVNSLDNFDIVMGNFSSDGKLKTESCIPMPGCTAVNIMFRDSTASNGSWSFDFNINGDLFFYFVGLGKSTGIVGGGLYPNEGYRLGIILNDKRVNLDYISDTSMTVGSYLSPTDYSGWMQMNITRDPSGKFEIFLDGNSIINGTQIALTTSEHINIQMGANSQLDNLTYTELHWPDPLKEDADEGNILSDNYDLFAIPVALVLIIALFYIRKRS